MEVDDRVTEVLVGLSATRGRVLRNTEKATVVEAVWSGRRVVVKVLTTADAYWRQRWQREAYLYAAFAAGPLPFPVPRLLHEGDGMRVLEYVDAAPLHSDRYPADPLDADAVSAVVDTVSSFAAWPAADLPDVDYRHLLDRASPGPDRDAVAAVLGGITAPLVAQHGDPLPSNLLATEDDRCVLVDFEHSGRFLPGYDLAVLTCLLAGQPEPVRHVVADVAATVEQTCFAVNLWLVVDRETRIHRAFEPDRERRRRLALLESVAGIANQMLRPS